MNAGLKRVYFTGGEPLTSPMARPVLEGLPEPGPDTSYTLITNGTRVRTHRSWLARTQLDKVKVSLHYFSDASLRAIAGTRIGIGTVLDGIEVAREIFERVELNTLLQKENAHEVRQILDFALERRLPVQFIELVGTDFNEGHAASAAPADDIIAHLRTLTSDEHLEVAGVGQGRRVFRIDGVEIDVIHRDLGRHHVGQCGTCPVRAEVRRGLLGAAGRPRRGRAALPSPRRPAAGRERPDRRAGPARRDGRRPCGGVHGGNAVSLPTPYRPVSLDGTPPSVHRPRRRLRHRQVHPHPRVDQAAGRDLAAHPARSPHRLVRPRQHGCAPYRSSRSTCPACCTPPTRYAWPGRSARSSPTATPPPWSPATPPSTRSPSRRSPSLLAPFRPYLETPTRTFYLTCTEAALRQRIAAKSDTKQDDLDLFAVPGRLTRLLANFQTVEAADPTAVALDTDDTSPDDLADWITAHLEAPGA